MKRKWRISAIAAHRILRPLTLSHTYACMHARTRTYTRMDGRAPRIPKLMLRNLCQVITNVSYNRTSVSFDGSCLKRVFCSKASSLALVWYCWAAVDIPPLEDPDDGVMAAVSRLQHTGVQEGDYLDRVFPTRTSSAWCRTGITLQLNFLQVQCKKQIVFLNFGCHLVWARGFIWYCKNCFLKSTHNQTVPQVACMFSRIDVT